MRILNFVNQKDQSNSQGNRGFCNTTPITLFKGCRSNLRIYLNAKSRIHDLESLRLKRDWKLMG
ncbi:hypothetical protein FIM72_01030 [Helicobacter pylori]|nr:hypothetical protein FIM72_01030 [Helicobacter pylori]